MDVLEAFVRCGDEARSQELGIESGHRRETVYRSLRKLVALDLVLRPRPKTKWQITERGKIALALHKGREARRVTHEMHHADRWDHLRTVDIDG